MATNPSTPGAPAPAADAPPSGVDLKTILDYDPFEKPAETPTLEPGNEPSAPGTTVETAQPDPQATPQPGAQPSTDPNAPPPMTQEAIEAMIAERVAEQVAERVAQLQQPTPQAQPGQQGYQPQPNQPGGQQQQQPQRRYGFNVPQQIFDGLNAEDPNVRNQSLVTVMNGMAEIIHDTVLQQVTQLVEQVRGEVPQVAAQHSQQIAEQKAVFDDFYGAWPALNNPAFHSIVGQTAARLAKNHRGYSPALRDEIGREVYKTLKWPMPGQRQNAPKPAPASSGSARPGSPAPMDEQQKEMMDMFGPS